MSSYKNFVEDFPNRCSQILDTFYEPAKNLSECPEINDGREITLLIMTASAGFVIPFERLRRDRRTEHIAKDREKYPKVAENIDKFLDGRFVKSKLFRESQKSWAHGTFNKRNRENINEWNEIHDCNEVSKDIDVNCIISTIRKALAHGSIYTINESENRINEIIFISETKKPSDTYRFVKVSTNDFKMFLEAWFDFLKLAKDKLSLVAYKLEKFTQKDK